MKVLHVIPSYVPAYRYGGPVYSVHGLCRALVGRGLALDVFTTNRDGPGESAVPIGEPVDVDGVRVWYYRCPALRRLFWAPAMGRALRRRVAGYDLVHVHALFLWTSVAAGRAARRAGVPYIVSPRGMLVRDLVRGRSSWAKTGWIRLFGRKLLANAAALHVTSSVEAGAVRSFGLALPPLFVVPNGIDPPAGAGDGRASRPEADDADRPSDLLFLGRISWEKGLDRLLVALRSVPGAQLTIAGNDEGGYRPRLERQAQAAGVADRVRFTGPVADARKRALLQSAKLLVLPSYSENFGNVVLEAMAEGCPAVVTPEVGASDLLVESGAGIVAGGSPETLGPAIAALLADAGRRREMGERGREAARVRYCWSAVGLLMEQQYRRVVGAR